ncbi:MAG: nucleotidyltransferase family protein [Lachnospiraceae bacterium]|nr:nucleotidyltransferase family protein [Lachnospiraceae bacterium]
MRTTAIIAEYNPFHNGHSYHIKKARELTDADFILVLISGDYVQRGTPAVIDKYRRAEMALSQGADLVLELPLYYSLGSLEYFAKGAVSLLDRLGLVDYLSFGSESGELALLKETADALDERESPEYQERLRGYIRKGLSFPAAQEKAMVELGLSEKSAAVIREPNNALAIAYLRALKARGSKITPVTLKRYLSAHHDNTEGSYSATAIRSRLQSKEALFDLAMSLPDTVLQIMVSDYDKRFPVTENDFSGALFYKLHSCYTKALQEYGDRETARKKALTGFLDINEELSSRLLSIYKEASSFSDLCGKVKSKDLTYTRISRAAMHIILDISAANMKEYIADDYNYYARILGFRSGESTASLLHGLKQSSALPLITKLADADKILTGRNARRLLSEEIQASDLYERTACMKYHGLFRSEYVRNIVKY